MSTNNHLCATCGNTDVDGSRGYIDDILSNEEEKWLPAIFQVKNSVVGNNKQKASAISCGIVPRLLQWMVNDDVNVELRIEAAIVLGSIAKGTKENIQKLIDEECLLVLLKGVASSNIKYIEACLRCLRTIYVSQLAPAEPLFQDAIIVPHLMNIMSRSTCTQECIATIFAYCCKTLRHQDILLKNGAISALAPLLCSNKYKVQMPTLKCFAVLCHENEQVSAAVMKETYNGEPIIDLLLKLLARDKTSEMQMAAAKCLTYLCRSGAIEPTQSIIVLKTLPTLVRMCKKDRTLEENVEGAETLAYLIEVSSELQQVASITDHLIKTLAEYLKYTDVQQININNSIIKKDLDWASELKQAALVAFASLAANDEDIRKRIIETENLMDHIMNGMNSDNPKVQASAVRCLHSLSRSVQQLRTTFKGREAWKPLMQLVDNGSEEVLSVASSTMCNLLLDFSPSKDNIIEVGAVRILVDLTMKPDAALRLNGIWGLMNLAFRVDEKVKEQIIEKMGAEQLFNLLSDPDPNILMKTLGLLRNLLSSKPHIDNIMTLYGNQIMQAVVFILEGDHGVDVKEQTLCILANVADGDQAKECIMGNEDVLKKLMSYMIHANVKLQIAATFCISNLVWNEDQGAYSRQSKLRELGIQKLLQQLLSTSDSTLFDKVKTALQQFT